MRRILLPFQGLDDVAFGMSMNEVQKIVGIAESSVKNKYLHQEQVATERIKYIFEKRILVTIELLYQDGVYYNNVDVFNTRAMETLFPGHTIQRRREAMHIKALGMILLSFHRKDLQKRELWYYSKQMVPEFETFLDVV
jgi:hypothetical protein